MPGGGGDTAADGGEFLLSLLQKKPHHHFHHPQTPTHPQHQHLNFDPAVALMGPTTDLSPPPYPPNLNRFSQHNTGNNSQFQGNHGAVGDDFWRLGSSGADAIGGNVTRHLLQQKPQNHKLMFGSLPFEIQNQKGMFDGNSLRDGNRQLDPRVNSNSDPSNALRHGIYNSRELQELRGGGGRGGGWGQHQQHTIRPPPGFPSQTSGGGGIWDTVNREKGNFSSISDADDKGRRFFTEDSRTPMSNMYPQSGLSKQQFEHHRMHNFDSEIADHANGDENQGRGWDGLRPGYDRGSHELDDLGEEIVHSLLLEDDSNEKSEQKKNRNARDKDCRSDSRGQRLLSQRMRNLKRMMGCRDDIYKLNAPFLAIYESLIPPEKEKANQRHLFTLLEKLVAKEWPEARLYLYGSCASTFGVCKSDIDVCLAIDDVDVDKPKVLLKLAEILQSDNLENVQALTRARVPIVKLMDPVTGISCDICINNVLAVVNTKLLRDYAQIDVRLHQLAFIVKHWAKSRGVNETYQGTLSSYAYVLMCIHFLQQRRPAILPCLQEMETTYSVTVDDIKCAFFDKVEKLRTFGSRNRESIAQLVWGFFNYWAYCHDYANDVISVRAGSIISKRAKDWTRRIGNDRHLICIEDPFEISHDLGRVVDKYSIKVLREEFELAADIVQFDPNPCISLFEPYVVS